MRIVLACSLSVVLALGLSPVASADPPDASELALPIPTDASTESDYIVTLADAPIAAYDGDVAGYDATQPADGEDVDVDSADAKRYRSYLRKRQDTVAARVGSTPDERYEVGVNAFTAEITGQQAATLARTDGVVSVHRNTLRRVPDDKKSVDFLGLSGLRRCLVEARWSRRSRPRCGRRGDRLRHLARERLVRRRSAPDVDAGRRGRAGSAFVPTRSGDTITMTKSDGGTFTGTCQAGEDFTVDDCSSKIVGARYFGEDLAEARVKPAERSDDDVRLARATARVTAATPPRSPSATTGSGPSSTTATSAGSPASPRRRRSPSYKVLWQAKDATQSGAYDSDILAAIDAAIGDGVDVINFSITAADDPTAPVQLAFLAAASAGIFVATSAGNSGPGASTVQSTSPWVTTVGAHSIAPYYGTVTLGDGRAYAGVSTSVDEPVGPARLVNGAAVAAVGPDRGERGRVRTEQPRPGEDRRQDRGLRPRGGRTGS